MSGSARNVFSGYEPLASSFDEYFDPEGQCRVETSIIADQLAELGEGELSMRQTLASRAFMRGGVTFSVYADNRGQERIFPFDVIPRVIDAAAWDTIERGLIQRVQTLNLFLADIYGERRILKEKVLDEHFVLRSTGYLPECEGMKPPGGVHIHIGGIDLIRDAAGEFVVLEDNVRIPSGVSYVLENRAMMKRLLPKVFRRSSVAPVDMYPIELRKALRQTAVGQGHIVVLTPGPYNSAYFEHSFLARRIGAPLVQGTDLFVGDDDHVYMRTVAGPERVSAIYRRVDDAFLDPEVFRNDSMLGVPGLMRAFRAGNVTLANAPGNGVADDKGVYPFVPEMIRFYLGEDPILGQVETFICARPKELDHVLQNLDKFVVKAMDGTGGYGMLVGPVASQAEREAFAVQLKAKPAGYIAQPLVEFSTAPTLADGSPAPRRVDLRPFVITGDRTWVLPGGLTRVALVEGSYVVNSSQGGGSKDTWVLRG